MYGSGQPTGKEVFVAHDEGVKSIINLRGDRRGRMEWHVESGVALALDMPVRCHTMPSGRLRTKSEDIVPLGPFRGFRDSCAHPLCCWSG